MQSRPTLKRDPLCRQIAVQTKSFSGMICAEEKSECTIKACRNEGECSPLIRAALAIGAFTSAPALSRGFNPGEFVFRAIPALIGVLFAWALSDTSTAPNFDRRILSRIESGQLP